MRPRRTRRCWRQPAGENGPARIVWAAHKDTPYAGVNKPVTHIADILKAHQGKQSWDQPVMLTRDYDGHYVSLAPGEKTKCQFYADDRVFGWIYSGQVKITIDGQQPVTATKGYLFDVAPRLSYCMENTGTEPVVFYRSTPAGQVPSYPENETPTPVKGYHYDKAKITSTGGYEGGQPALPGFQRLCRRGGKSRDFAMDGHTSRPYHPRRRHHQAAARYQLGPFPREYGGSLGGDRRPAGCADYRLRRGAWRNRRCDPGQ